MLRALSRLFGYTMLILNIFAAIWLGLCYAASVTSPVKVHSLELFSLTTPFAIIVNLFFVFFWIFSRRKWRTIFPVITLIAGYKLIITVIAFNFFGSNNMSAGTNTVKVMSWNVHGMGIYDKRGNNIGQRIVDVIKKESPDILCMPEFFKYSNDSIKPYSTEIYQDNNFKDYRFNTDNTLGAQYYLGIALYTKLPIVEYKVYKIGQSIYLLQCDFQLPNAKIIRMFFVHLYSYNLSDYDRQYFSEIKAKKHLGRTDLKYSRFYIWRFNYSYAERANEADTIAKIMARSPYPVLICGDYNDLPCSYTYTKIRGNLKDAFLEKGKGFGRTYNQIFPTLRIDHILYDPTYLHILGYKSPNIKLSDHNPVIANFSVTDSVSQ